MNIILLSGGSGKRLWPLSNDIRSKQFIKIFRKKDGFIPEDAVVTDDITAEDEGEVRLIGSKWENRYVR